MNNRDVLILSILTFITTIAWIVFDAYHAYTVSNISPSLEKAVLPLDSKVDTETIEKLKERQRIVSSLPLPEVTISVATTGGEATASPTPHR